MPTGHFSSSSSFFFYRNVPPLINTVFTSGYVNAVLETLLSENVSAYFTMPLDLSSYCGVSGCYVVLVHRQI